METEQFKMSVLLFRPLSWELGKENKPIMMALGFECTPIVTGVS